MINGSYQFVFYISFILLLIGCDGAAEITPAKCFQLDISVTQKIDHEGFHREIGWLVESSSPAKPECKLLLMIVMSTGMYVDPDQISEANRTNELNIFIDGSVDIEKPAYEATEHKVYIFLKNDNFIRHSINLPFHLRYQSAQITGGFAKVPVNKPSILAWCPESERPICSADDRKVDGPCDRTGNSKCVWNNISYQALFDGAELYVPVGDLDDYPMVSIITLLLACAGCIYIVSILSTAPL